MNVEIVVAMGRGGEIGKAGGLPWPRLAEDMKRFRSLTMGHAVVMGSRTWDSIPFKPLDGRCNIVMGRDEDAIYERIRSVDRGRRHLIEPASTISRALILADAWNTWKDQSGLFVIGGAAIYSLFLPIASKIHLTRIDASFPDADTYFPGGYPYVTAVGDWYQAGLPHNFRDPSGLEFQFITLSRKSAK